LGVEASNTLVKATAARVGGWATLLGEPLFIAFIAAEMPPQRLGWLGERKKCIKLALAGQ
jgi:hypothetical protein